MKKLLLLLAIGLLCLNVVTALEIEAEYKDNVMIRGIENSIELTITITNATTGQYNLYTLSDISLRPSETFTIDEDTFVKTFTISPTENLDVEGYYIFTYTLNYRGIEKFDNKMTINIIELEDAIEISSDSINPESGEVSFYVQNKENVEMKNLSAKFSSVLFETEETFDLGPNEKKIFSVDVDKGKLEKTKAGVYVINSIFETAKGNKKVEGNLYINEKKGITVTEDKSGILIKSQTITKVNVGNVVENIEVKINRNIFSRLFTTFNIEPNLVERKGLSIEYTWTKQKLNPTEAYVIKAKTNYILPFFTIIVIILVLLGLKRFTETKLEVRKSVSHVKTKNGEFALKVRLSLKAKKDIENVSIIDKVPAIVKIYNKFGMAKPDKIDAKNRRIHWNIGDLNASEERLFTYIVYSKVGFVGKFSLPEALAVFEKDSKIHEVESNKVFFMSDQVKGD